MPIFSQLQEDGIYTLSPLFLRGGYANEDDCDWCVVELGLQDPVALALLAKPGLVRVGFPTTQHGRMRSPGSFAAHGNQRLEVWSGVKVFVIGGGCHQQEIALRRGALMIAVHPHDAGAERVNPRPGCLATA